MTRRRCLIYSRHSSLKQSSGDSQARQLRRAIEWIESNGHFLDQTFKFEDKAISAKAGDPVKKGQLGQLLKLCKAGKISTDAKGIKPLLIVEDISRLSRESINPALSLILNILNYCDLVVLSDGGKVYTETMELTDIIVLLVGVSRANEENIIKSERIRQARTKKTSSYAQTGIKITSQCPVWLELAPCKTKWIQRKEYVDLVKFVFDRIEAGDGMHRILTAINSSGYPRAKRGGPWTVSTLGLMVKTKKVIGEFENSKGKVFLDYYPQIIDPEQFYRVQQLRKTRGKGSGGPSSSILKNLFKGVATCGQCEDGTMQYLSHGGNDKWIYLVCSNARQGRGCKQHSYRYHETEDFLLKLFSVLDFSKSLSSSKDSLLADIGKLQEDKLKIEEAINNLVAAVEATGNVSLVKKLTIREDELSRISQELEQKEIEASANTAGDPNEQFKKMISTQDRQLLNDFLRRNIDKLAFTPEEVLIQISGQPWAALIAWDYEISPKTFKHYYDSEELQAYMTYEKEKFMIFEFNNSNRHVTF